MRPLPPSKTALSLIRSGAQQLMPQACIASCDSFAYASTLAIYVLNLKSFGLERVLSGPQKSYTSCCWNPHDPNQIATGSSDQDMTVWNLEDETKVATISVPVGYLPTRMRWSLTDRNAIFSAMGSKLFSWDLHPSSRSPLTMLKDFEAKITTYYINSKNKTQIAVAVDNGQMFLYDAQSGKTTKWIKYEEAVLCCEFDPLSDNYMLVALRSGVIALLDVNQAKEACVLSVFTKQPAGLRGISFVPTIPGGFVTYSDRASVLRLWNVSQPSPVALLKVARQSAMHSVTFVPQSAVAICTLVDGGVIVFDVQAQRKLWASEGGHTETIFDCQFCPTRPLVMATASYDATVRLWHTDNTACSITLTGASGPLYSVCWSPDGARLAASGVHGEVFLYDLTRASVVCICRHHSKAVYRVDWSHVDPDLLASASGDSTCVLFRSSGVVVAALTHPAPCFGCAFSPPGCGEPRLAVACADSNIYLYSVGGTIAHEKALTGHLAKVFNVRWSPLVPSLLASTSDDGSARVWDAEMGQCGAVLVGHSSNVRGIVLHSELKEIAITGSWDATIRIWNVETAECLKVLADHHADVYGLAMHPQRPFALASSSRDTTLRFWTLGMLAPSLPLRAAFGLPFTRTQAGPEAAAPHTGFLEGQASAALAQALLDGRSELDKGALISAFFGCGAGMERLWELARIIDAGGTEARSPGTASQAGHNSSSHLGSSASVSAAWPPPGLAQLASGVDSHTVDMLHVSEVEPVLAARAARLEAARTGRAAAGGLKREESLLAAAALWLHLGNLEGYCEIMRELGQWDRALAVAPAIGLEYWQELVRARAEDLAEAGASVETLAPLLVASQQIPRLQDALWESGQLEECFALAAVHAVGGYDHLAPAMPLRAKGQAPQGAHVQRPPPPWLSAPVSADAGPAPADLQRLHAVRLQQAEQRLADGEPLWAAASLLTVNDAEGAVGFLLRGFEPDAAVLLARALLKNSDGPLKAARAAADRAAALDDAELTAAVLRGLPEGERRERGETLALRAAAHLDIDGSLEACYRGFGLPSPENFLIDAQQAEGSGRLASAAVYYSLGRSFDKALPVGLSFLRLRAAALLGRLPSPGDAEGEVGENVAEARRVVEALAHCPPGGAQGLYSPHRRELIAYASYFGARSATQEGHLPVVRALYRQCVESAKAADPGCPLRNASEALLLEEHSATWSLHPEESRREIEQLAGSPGCPVDVASAGRQLLASAAAGGAWAPEDRSVRPMGAAIPSGAVRLVSPPSVISGARVSSTPITIDDSGACMTLGETLMWARATPFAPTESGLPLLVVPI